MEEVDKPLEGLELQTCLFCNKYFDKKPDIGLSSSGEITGFESALTLFCEFISRDNNELLKRLKSDNCKVGHPCCSECHFNLLEFERCERIIKETKLAQENILKTLKDALLHPKSFFSSSPRQNSLLPRSISLREALIEEIKKDDSDEEDIECDSDDSDNELNDMENDIKEEKDPLEFNNDFPSPLALVSLEYNSTFETVDNGSPSPSVKPSKRKCSNLVTNKGKGRMRSTIVEKTNQSVGHIDAHTCSFCGKRFANTGSLSNHRKRHGPPSLPCPVCNKLFHFPNELRRHMKAAHP